MIRFFYSCLTYLLFPFVKKRLKKRFDKEYLLKRTFKGKQTKKQFDYIIHAASVGEQILVAPLVKQLQEKGFRILLTAATDTGFNIATKTAKTKENVEAEYLPFDLYFPVKKFLKYRNTKKLILVETELWINLIEEAYNNNTEIIIVNGRISNSSFKTYQKLKFMFKNSLNKISKCLVRYEEDAKRFEQLGIAKSKIKITGNLKLAMNPKVEKLEINSKKPIVLFASTREKEEGIILNSIKILIENNEISTIFAPRHPERTKEIETLIKQQGFFVTFSKGNKSFNLKDNEVLIVNETGRLISFYNKADLVFVGGSLVSLGGQNFVEPFFFEKPVITGKHLDNFLDILPLFRPCLTVVEDENQLKEQIASYLKDPNSFILKGKQGKEILNKQQNSLSLTLKEIVNVNQQNT